MLAALQRSGKGAFRPAPQWAGLIKRDVGGHTLRQAYATHVLAAGVNLRAIPRYLGHAHLATTLLFLHLTQKGHEDASQRLAALSAAHRKYRASLARGNRLFLQALLF